MESDILATEVTPSSAASAVATMTAEDIFEIDRALVAAGRVDEAGIWAATILDAVPSHRDLLSALARRLIRAGRPEEAFARLARGIDAARGDAVLLVLASRIVTAAPIADVAVDAVRRAGEAAPDDPRIQEGVIRTLLASGRAEEARHHLPAITSDADRRSSSALLVADVHAAVGDTARALDMLERARALAKPAELAKIEKSRRAVCWRFAGDLARAEADPMAADWTGLAARITADGLPLGRWDDLIAAARRADVLDRLADALSHALDDPTLRSRLEPVFIEVTAGDPGRAADRLCELPVDDRRAVTIDELTLASGRPDLADARARTHLLSHPSCLTLGRRLVSRLDRCFHHEEIDRICASARTVAPADARWALLWAGHLGRSLRYAEAIAVCRGAIDAGSNHVGLWYALATHLLRSGEPEEALRVRAEAVARFGATADLAEIEAEALAALGRRDDMAGAIAEGRRLADAALAADPANKARHDRLTTRLDWLQALLDSGEILASVPVTEPVRGVVAILSQRSPFLLMWSLLAACELRRRGFETVFLDAPAVAAIPPRDPEIAAFDGILDPTGRRFRGRPAPSGPHRGWVADPAARRLGRAGYELHQPVVERITTLQRRYRIVPGPQADGVRADALLRADVAIEVCERLGELARRRGLELRLFGLMTHYSPGCIYKQFCARVWPDLPAEYVEFNVGYEQYRSNRTDEGATTVSAANLTRHPDLRLSIHTSAEAFEDWLSRHAAEADAIVAEADRILVLDRSKRDASPEAAAMRERILAHRASGGRVVCLLGKVTYDIAIEEEGGPAHVDMVDWLNHTIDCVRGRDDVLLLIKPHPYEILPEVADPTESFTDLIGVDLPDNCVVLGHRWFNLAEVLPLVDLVSIWHGTATLEVLAQGTPLVVGATWGVKDHPIEVIAPRDRDDYRDIVVSHRPRPVAEAIRRRAKLLIAHLVSEDVMVPYRYGNLFALRAATSRRWGWNLDAVERWLAEGDPHVDYLADIAQWGRRRPK